MKLPIETERGFTEPTANQDIMSVWQLPQEYRCPVIGICLTSDEHKRVVRKSGFKLKGMKLYQVHRTIMMNLNSENSLSRRVDTLLRGKYREYLALMDSWSEERLRSEWGRALQSKKFDALLYVIATRRGVSESTLDNVFGETHMISHTLINQESGVNKEIVRLKVALAKLENRYQFKQNINRELKRENRILNRENAMLKANEKTPLSGITSRNNLSPVSHRSESDRIKRMERRNHDLRWRQEKLEQTNQELRSTIEEHEAMNTHLKGDIEELISHFSLLTEKFQSTHKQNSSPDLSSKRVLIVGGMTKIKHLYKHLVESNGGKFEYHDGYLKNGSKKLCSKVNRSDLIICPVNCNSHNACHKVKKLCHRYNKQLKILSNSSISSVSAALFSNAVSVNAVSV